MAKFHTEYSFIETDLDQLNNSSYTKFMLYLFLKEKKIALKYIFN